MCERVTMWRAWQAKAFKCYRSTWHFHTQFSLRTIFCSFQLFFSDEDWISKSHLLLFSLELQHMRNLVLTESSILRHVSTLTISGEIRVHFCELRLDKTLFDGFNIPCHKTLTKEKNRRSFNL